MWVEGKVKFCTNRAGTRHESPGCAPARRPETAEEVESAPTTNRATDQRLAAPESLSICPFARTFKPRKVFVATTDKFSPVLRRMKTPYCVQDGLQAKSGEILPAQNPRKEAARRGWKGRSPLLRRDSDRARTGTSPM
jgi:hypothetical protein